MPRQRRFGVMRRPFYYYAQADHARRLADMTVQAYVEVRRDADEFDRLAQNVAAGKADSTDSKIPERS